MIRIARAELSAGLTKQLTELTEEIASHPEARRADIADSLWKNRKSVRKPLRTTLATTAPGLERCMYCGDSQGCAIDHFEPKSRNPLRTFDWLNHLLACTPCNSTHKGTQFPVDDDGQPLLIDPTAEDPFEHLHLVLSIGVYQPLTTKGAVTTDVLQLNRYQLTDGRAEARAIAGDVLRNWHEAYRNDNPAEMLKQVKRFRQQPFADVCQAMLRQAMAPAASEIFSDRPKELALLRLPELRAALLN